MNIEKITSVALPDGQGSHQPSKRRGSQYTRPQKQRIFAV